MVTSAELLRVLLAPLIVSASIAALGYWRRWTWALPLAAGAGFVAGYALMGVPKLPPQDGTDWLFWLAMPLTLVGVLSTLIPARWRWPVGILVAAIAIVMLRPLMPDGVNAGQATMFAIGFGVVGMAIALTATAVESRVTPMATILALSLTLGATAVIVMSSNLRIVGIYGIAAAAAVGPVAIFAGPWRAGSRRYRTPVSASVAIVTAGLLTGLFTAGRFYPDPGVTWTNLLVVAFAPLLLLPAAYLPIENKFVRAAIGVALVVITLGIVTGPTALAAKHAAEDDPYGSNG